jgi:hypothetical protein
MTMKTNAIPTGLALDREMGGLAAAGFQAVVAVFRNQREELRTLSMLESGADLAGFLEWLADAEVAPSPSHSVGATVDTSPADDQVLRALLAQMQAQGFEPFFLAFLDEHERAEVLAHSEIDDVEHFVRWLAAEVDEGETRDVSN